MTVAECLADQLFNNGVRHVFGIPGGPSIPYLEAFRAAGIDFILTSNESAAGIMAEVSACLTGVPGVCHATFGPGATNLSTGIGGALLDRSPVILLTSEINDMMLHRTTQMNIDHQQLFKPLTKATFRLTPENAKDTIAGAIKLCKEEYPGPVHLGLPSDSADKEIIAGRLTESIPGEEYGNRDTMNIITMLENARNPLLAVGLTSARFGITGRIKSFLERHKMPVVVTPMAKGLISENNPCYAGVLFHALSDYLEPLYENVDLIIGLGYDSVEYNYESWIPDVPMIQFNTIETDLPLNNKVYQYIGHPDSWFEILERINPGMSLFNPSDVESVRNEIEAVLEGFTGHFGPVAAMKILQEELSGDSIITFDVGSHLHLAGQYWKTFGRRNLLMTNGWSGMGFGIPAALAAQINDPRSNVACITGDGGFLMMAGEIITARRYNLPVIIVVFSDGELNLIRIKQSWQNLSPNGTTLYSGDLFGADTFLGIRVIIADSEEKMRQAIYAALSINGPVIINARIDPDDYRWLITRQKS